MLHYYCNNQNYGVKLRGSGSAYHNCRPSDWAKLHVPVMDNIELAVKSVCYALHNFVLFHSDKAHTCDMVLTFAESKLFHVKINLL